jgi:carboxylesterase
VRAPLLPGHGRDLRAMSTGRAWKWLDGARRALHTLRVTHDTVVIVGQSMGAALAVQLAVEADDVPALVLLAPFIGVPPRLSLKFAASWIPQAMVPYRVSTGGERSIHDPDARVHALGTGVVTARVLHELQKTARRAEAVLPAVHAPVLYLQSVEDNRIRAIDAEQNFRRLGSKNRELRWIEGAGHIIAIDYCKDDVARGTIEWIVRWAGAPSEVAEARGM